MTKESAILNASIIHSMMMQFDFFCSVHFEIYNLTNECLVYAFYNPSDVHFPDLKERFSVPSIKDSYFEDREIEGLTKRMFSFTWLWDDETSDQPTKTHQ